MSEMKVKISEGGRIVIPASLREQMGVNIGDELVVKLEDGELKLYTVEQAVKKAQSALRRYVPKGKSLVDELMRERRADAGYEG
ncbi:AbrB/MazE/SpoVT family DNA-binding domain-containing protein [Paenibacillus sp. TRM 82003]|nr:AbrB/MazE/SpoVT family DNA-binding domain-containing protein [Paenibacillus sp. TRM 82003]